MTIAKKPLTPKQINIILSEIIVEVLKDEDLWTKIGHELDLSDGDINRAWDYANAQIRTRGPKMNREKIQNDDVEAVIGGMDHKTMYQYVYDTLDQSLSTYSDEQLEVLVKSK